MTSVGIVLDSSFLYALLIKKDKNHESAEMILKNLEWEKFGPVVTIGLVVNETFTLMNIRTKGNNTAIEQLNDIFYGEKNFFSIIYLNEEDFKSTVNLMKNYSEKERILSFVDAALIYLAKRIRYEKIISFDSHFDGILTRIFE